MNTPINNPYALTKEEQEQWDTWEAMSDDEKGTVIFNTKQELSNADYITSKVEHEQANQNVIQRSPTGGIQIGGDLRADTLINVDGMEMTVQQAVDVGIADSQYIGQQTATLTNN